MGFAREDLIPTNLRLAAWSNSQSSVILGRSFSVTRNGRCASVLLNTLDTTVSIQRGKKLGYALPMKTDYEYTQNLKRYNVKDSC